MSFNRLILIWILFTYLDYKIQANKDTKLHKINVSPGYGQKLYHPGMGIIAMRSKAKRMKYPNANLIYMSSESDSSDQNREETRRRVQSSDSEEYNSTEIEKVIFLPNNTHKYIKTAEVVDSTNEDVENGTTVQSLRDAEELKCIDACEEVLGNVCDAHSCRHKERHVFEKECFSACESRFR